MSYTDLGNRILKVNHAGENGAIHIYAGQIWAARFTAPSMVDELKTFKTHEEQHRAIFQKELVRRAVPRCKSYTLCAMGGFVLGVTTGLLGKSAIVATTVAVERVVLRHLKHQLAVLEGKDTTAALAITTIIDDEQMHYDHSAAHLTKHRFWVGVIAPVVAISTEFVIWLGMRL
jgi:3-demethoxyubiquinol 3-hydroxylase